MNATTPEPNEKPLERRESDGSGSSSNDNPLMKLVDAALAPSNTKDDLMKPTLMDTTSNKESTDSVADSKDSSHSSVEGESEVAATTTSATEPTQEAAILKGTVQDLVSRQDKKLTFAEYLMQCLNDETNHDVLQWMPCGLQFTITNHRKFTMERMPTLFKIRNMSSFVRKLTRWGFSRVHEKETGNSDIFKHPLFQKDKPELCKKIRCVNRSSATPAVPHKPLPPYMGHAGDMMGNISESSMRHGMHGPTDMHMVSPRRSMGSTGSMGHGGPYMVSGGRPPYQTGRYAPPQPTPGGPPHQHHHHHPRVSPEYEKEMIQGNSFHPRHPGPPQVYSPPPIGRSMSAAAEYELEQVLLERQRARNAMYQQGPPPPGQHPQGQQHQQSQQQQQVIQQQQQQPQQHPGPGGSPSLLGNGSERSMSSGATAMTTDARGRYVPVDSPNTLASATNSVVTAALETLQREGDYEFDMSPREAMLRAVLHKRQQQRAAQQQHQGGVPPVQQHPQQQQQQQGRPMMQQQQQRGPLPPPNNGQGVFVDAANNATPPPPPPPQVRAVPHPPQPQQQPLYYSRGV